MVSDLFKDLCEHKTDYLSAQEGEEFEDRIEKKLRSMGFTKILPNTPTVVHDIPRDRWNILKEKIQSYTNKTFLDVLQGEENSFIRGPFSSQGYPDFLIFTNKKVIPLEIKFSQKSESTPFWNSGLPRETGFYIFGSYKLRDITFFCGADVLNEDRRQILLSFFEKMTAERNRFNEKLSRLIDAESRGFVVDVRRTYSQKGGSDKTNYFKHELRKEVENKAIERVKELERW